MNCAEANQIDMVDYLNSMGYQPQKISGNDYWYLSPLRDENHASFKVDRAKNVWYDHGIGKGGSLIDFLIELHQCDVREAMQKLPFFHPQNIVKHHLEKPQFHLHENSLIHHEDASQTGIRIIAAKQPIDDPLLCRYLKQRNISKNTAEKWCYEVHFTAGEKEKISVLQALKITLVAMNYATNILKEAVLQNMCLTSIIKQIIFQCLKAFLTS